MARNENLEEMDRREYRRKRRIRNQVISYIVLAVILAGVAAGAFVGIKQLMKVISDKKQAQALQAQLDELAESEPEVVGVPESLVETVPEEKSPLDEFIDERIEEMPLEDKVAGLFFVTPEALTGANPAVRAGDTTRDRLTQYTVGGLIYSTQNLQSRGQVEEMLVNTKEYSKYPIFLGVDEEGGTVSRVAESGLAQNVGAMAEIGASGDTMQARQAGVSIGNYLAELGFNVDFAPVADVIIEGNTVIGDRSFGTDIQMVSDMVAASVEGIESTGVSACLKHFPGLGTAMEDTHEGMVRSERSLDEFTSYDFPAFQAGINAGADFVMVGHLSVPSVIGNDDITPSSMSAQVITNILREQLGYDGIVITDALDMEAITGYYTAEQAAVMAVQAGADMLLMPEDFEAAYNGILNAVYEGTLSEERLNESLRRIYRVKYRDAV